MDSFNMEANRMPSPSFPPEYFSSIRGVLLRGVLRGAFGAGGNPVLSLDLSFPFPVRLSPQQLAVY
jgi:hypothetical protein